MKNYFLYLFLLAGLSLQALPKDTLYHIRFISTEDLSALYYAPVKAERNGIIIASWKADIDGCITIRKQDIRPCLNVTITINYPGFENVSFSPAKLFSNDTTTILVKPQASLLDEITVTAYKVPLIEKDVKSRSRRSKKDEHQLNPEPEKLPVHSPQQLNAYEALQKGFWLMKDTLIRKTIMAYDTASHHYRSDKNNYSAGYVFRNYLMQNIRYPRQAIDLEIQEKIYLSFEFDDKGSVQYIKVLRGNSVDFVLEMANALIRMPRLNLKNEVGEPYPRTQLKPARFILPVSFILR